MHSSLSYFQAIVMGLVQGITELFPVSSLGHGVILPALFGWHNLVNSQSAADGFFLAFLVGLHVGTAAGLLVFYRRSWFAMAGGLRQQVVLTRRQGPRALWALNDESTSPHYRLLVLLVIGTIPVGIVGLLFEHKLRVLFVHPLDAAIFLTINGVILLGGEVLRRRAPRHAARPTLATMSPTSAIAIGTSQILALFAGISRSGVTMVSGLLRGLDHTDAAEFAFLLATPVILLAGLLKLPDLFGPLGNGVRYQTLVGSIVAGFAAYISVRFLAKWFTTRTLWPFGVYSLVVGGLCIVRFA